MNCFKMNGSWLEGRHDEVSRLLLCHKIRGFISEKWVSRRKYFYCRAFFIIIEILRRSVLFKIGSCNKAFIGSFRGRTFICIQICFTLFIKQFENTKHVLNETFIRFHTIFITIVLVSHSILQYSFLEAFSRKSFYKSWWNWYWKTIYSFKK